MAMTISGTNGLTFPDSSVYAAAAGSFSTSGYQKLPNGLLLQWVVAGTTASASGQIAYTWPVAFTNNCFVALPVQNGIADSGEIGSSKSTTGGTIDYFGWSTSSKTFIVVGIGN